MFLEFHYDLVLLNQNLNNWNTKINCFINEVSEDDSDIDIGTVEVFYIDIDSALDAGVSAFELYDLFQETIGCFEELYDIKTQNVKKTIFKALEWCEPVHSNVLYINSIQIKPKYRGHNIGLAAIYRTIQQVARGCGLVILKAYPLQFIDPNLSEEPMPVEGIDKFSKDEKVATQKLIDYYSRLGFKSVPKTDYMLLNLEYNGPSLEDIGFEIPRSLLE